MRLFVSFYFAFRADLGPGPYKVNASLPCPIDTKGQSDPQVLGRSYLESGRGTAGKDWLER